MLTLGLGPEIIASFKLKLKLMQKLKPTPDVHTSNSTLLCFIELVQQQRDKERRSRTTNEAETRSNNVQFIDP
jgi:hypothetical protein